MSLDLEANGAGQMFGSGVEVGLPFRIAVLITTFRRPLLLRETLESLHLQTLSEPFIIVVSDNDQPASGGLEVASAWAFAHAAEGRLLCVAARKPGVAACRQAGLDAVLDAHSALEVIVMIDDDAVADPRWLEMLVNAFRELDAELMSGPVIFEFDAATPGWIANMSPFRVPEGPTGLSDRLRGACNTAVATKLLERLDQPYYDSAFAMGGEDVDFFARARRAGARIAWCAEAVVREPVPLDRCNETWMKSRMRRAGRTMVEVDRKQSNTGATAIRQCLLVTRALAGSLVRQVSARTDTQRMEAIMRRELALGRLEALTHRSRS